MSLSRLLGMGFVEFWKRGGRLWSSITVTRDGVG